MKPQIIVCGLGQTGYRIFTLLKQQGAGVVGISDRPLSHSSDDNIIIGNPQECSTLLKAGIKDAHTLVLASRDDAVNLAVLTQARVLNPNIRIINRLFNSTLGDRLDSTLPDHSSMSVSALAAPIFTFAAMGNQAIGQLQLFNQTWAIHEEKIDEKHPWLGVSLRDLWDNRSRMLIYYLPAKGKMDLVSAVLQERKLQVGDRIIIGTRPIFRQSRRSKLKKVFKAIANLRQYQHHVRPIALVTLALLITIFIATTTYIFVNFNTSFFESLYFSVGMITGAGGLEEVAEEGNNLIKVFTAIMMLVGAGVIGICYALINDFILGNRIKQFWDAARVPTHHHYIVCGLGGIGIQIVQQLYSQKQEIVIIETDPNNRFLHTARSMGIPIILEDATLLSSLKAVNIDKAEAVFAVTSNDMVNVEIALTVKAIVPKMHVIVRNSNSESTKAVQQVFNFQTVLCPTELASPSFAAAALGGKILGNGITGNLLWVALATRITASHPFCGKLVKEAAMEADFVPLYLESDRKTIHSWPLLETILSPGDILYLTMPATGLELLWRATPSQRIPSSLVS
ncbi:MAG: potassium channel family protein [Chroococcales cyanobacterium]